MEFDGKIENSETTLPVPEAKRKRQKGVTTVEYAVMLVLIAIAIMVANPNMQRCRRLFEHFEQACWVGSNSRAFNRSSM